MSSVEQRARELLAESLRKHGRPRAADAVLREGRDDFEESLDAIAAALREQPVQEGGGARLTNPWTGEPRDYRDVNSDPAGTLCVEPGAPLKAAPPSAPVGVAEALQRLIDNAATLGPASMEDALLVARYRSQALTQQPAQAAPGDDAKRLDWIESQVRQYGDGYTEPLEASVVVQWQQQKPNDRWPGLRAWVDEEMARSDDWLAATPPGDDAAGGA